MAKKNRTRHRGGNVGSREPLLSGSGSVGYGSVDKGIFDSSGSRQESETDIRQVELPEHAVPRHLGTFQLLALSCGCIVGSGIFVSPIAFIQTTGSVGMSLVFWAACGLLTLAMAMCYSELAILLPRSGGEYAYYKRIFGDWMAFLYAWVLLVAMLPAFCAVMAMVTSQYILVYVYPTCPIRNDVNIIIAVWILLGVMAINCMSLGYSTKFQAACTLAKFICLLAIIVGGMIQLAKGSTWILETGFEGSAERPGLYINAIYTGVFTYGGWQYMFLVTEEVKNPQRSLPLVGAASVLLVTCLYVLTNVAYFTVLTPAQMMASPAVAMTFAIQCLGYFAYAVPALVAVSTIGTLHGALMAAPRVFYTAGRDGLLPEIFSTISIRYQTPWPAIITPVLIAIVYICTGSFIQLMEYVGFVFLIVYTLSIMGLAHLRRIDPIARKQAKVPMLIVYLLISVNVVLLCMGLVESPVQYGIGAILILSGIPVYWIGVCWRPQPPELRETMKEYTKVLCKLMMVAPPDVKTSSHS